MRNLAWEIEDRTLVREFIDGNEKSFEILLYRYKSKIYTTIVLIVKDREVAEDLFQDTMVKAVEMIRAGRYNEEGKFLPWVIRIARNLAIDYFRKEKRNPQVRNNPQSETSYLEFAGSYDENPEEKVISEQTSRYVLELIDKLPEKQKEVLMMRHYSELSFKEISDLTSVSINTALGRMRYALVNLKRMVEKSGAEPVESASN
jgi:RNA polymerase sigma-70 factor (ECF subfamily)